MRRYLERRLEVVRKQGGEGLIAEIVRVEKEGQRISAREMVAMVFLLLGAGSETTMHLISGSVFELLRNPSLRDWLAADWSRANLAIEEFLRFVSPVQVTKPRFARHDVELGGVRIKKGEKIMAMLAAANMDPERERASGTARPRTCVPTGISRLEPASTSVSATSSRASKPNARLRLCSGAGRSSHSPFRRHRSAGVSAPGCGPLQTCRWWRRPDDRVADRPLVFHTFRTSSCVTLGSLGQAPEDEH